jgi:predicted nucleic acid-binding protein
MRLYLDSAPVIYSVEESPTFAPLVDERLRDAGVLSVASDLTRLECRTLPLRLGQASLLADYDRFFQEVVSEIVPLSSAVMDLATAVRADYGFKTPDAIHLAAALNTACDAFLTNDARLKRFIEVPIWVVGG